ncbi:MAG: tetratricopeptide repeat protein [Deltaproteobacteria bacterium]|nr:tetratricopeptide repeat protein [Deltaproteobacteria bacterium]
MNDAGYYRYAGEARRHIGDNAEAAEYFRKAYDLSPDWWLLYDIARCEATAKRYGLAVEAFEKYLSTGGERVDGKRVEEVKAEIERLKYEVGYLDITAPDGTDIIVDGVVRGRGPILSKVPVAASVEHKVGTKNKTRSINVEFGRTVAIGLKGDTEEDLDEDPDEDNGEAPSGLKTAGWILTSIGGATLLGSAVTGGLALSKNKDLKEGCAGSDCTPEYSGTLDKRDNLALTTNILWGVGGAALVAGIVLLAVAPKESKLSSASSGGKNQLKVHGAIGPDVAGVLLQWKF